MQPDATVVRAALAAGGVEGAALETTSLGLVCRVSAADAASALSALRTGPLGYAVLVDMLGIDTGEDIEVVYHLRSLARDEELFVKTRLPYGGQLASVWEVYPAALMPERETAELLGLMLAGHPNPKRLLTTDGTEPLLLKGVPVRGVEEMRDR